jgi:hypothetical protein
MYLLWVLLSVGPLIITISRMISDLKNFGILIVSFILGFSFALYAFERMFPDVARQGTGFNGDQGVRGFVSKISLLFYSLIGNFDSNLFSKVENFTTNVYLQILLSIYVIISLITLFNLLIAMMGATYKNVSESSFMQFRYNYAFILPPPFTLLVQAFYIPLYFTNRFWFRPEKNTWICFYCHNSNDLNLNGGKRVLKSFPPKHRFFLPGFQDCCRRCGAFKKTASIKHIIRRNVSCALIKMVGVFVSLVYRPIRAQQRAQSIAAKYVAQKAKAAKERIAKQVQINQAEKEKE